MAKEFVEGQKSHFMMPPSLQESRHHQLNEASVAFLGCNWINMVFPQM